jgi:hypothetical protein
MLKGAIALPRSSNLERLAFVNRKSDLTAATVVIATLRVERRRLYNSTREREICLLSCGLSCNRFAFVCVEEI